MGAQLPPRNSLAAVWTYASLSEYLEWRRANLENAVITHEAGHAVLMCALGVPGTHAKLAADGASGRVDHAAAHHVPNDAPVSLRAERAGAIWAAAVFHAGIAAEQILWGDKITGETHLTSTDDHACAVRIFGDLFTRRPHGFCQALARHVLIENWEGLQAIAQVLRIKRGWQPSDTPEIVPNLGAAEARVWEAISYLEEGIS